MTGSKASIASPTPAVTSPADRPALTGPALLSAFRAHVAGARSLESEFSANSCGYYLGGNRDSSEHASSGRTRLFWARPLRLRAQILESSTALLNGAALLTDDGGTVKIKAAGVLGFLPLSMTSGDTRLLTDRKHAFKNNHPMAHLQRLSGAAASWAVLPVPSPARDATAIDVTGVPRLDGEITREVLTVASSDLRPLSLAMYTGSRVVVLFRFESFAWNVPVRAASFTL